jgi:hypothetical protein
MRGIQSKHLTDLYTQQPLLQTEMRRVSELLCAAPGVNLNEAAAQLGMPLERIRLFSNQLGLGTFRDRVKRGGGLVANPASYSGAVSRQGLFPRRMGQIVEIDTTTVGVMVRDGVAAKLIATVACDSLTRTAVAVPGSDPSSLVKAIRDLEAVTGPAELILCDRRDGIPDAVRVATGIPVRAVERVMGDGRFTTHRVERANGWIKRVMAKHDCRLLKTIESVYDLLACAVAEYDTRYGTLPPKQMRQEVANAADLLLNPAEILRFAVSRGYRKPTTRAIDFYGHDTTDDAFAFVVHEAPAPARAGRMTRFAAARQPGFYWSATDASEET